MIQKQKQTAHIGQQDAQALVSFGMNTLKREINPMKRNENSINPFKI